RPTRTAPTASARPGPAIESIAKAGGRARLSSFRALGDAAVRLVDLLRVLGVELGQPALTADPGLQLGVDRPLEEPGVRVGGHVGLESAVGVLPLIRHAGERYHLR